MQTQNISALVAPSDAAKLLMTTVGTLAVWRSTKRYPLRFVRVGRKILYRVEDIQVFIEARTSNGDGSRAKKHAA
jgi:hypothetical protein